MAQYTLCNAFVEVVIDEHASEIIHFKNKATGFEHIWQGDPTYWKQHNPTLFPMVGKVFDGNIKIKDKIYHMGNHGFTRNSEFTCIKHTDDCIVMELKDSEETLLQYPFHFTLRIMYTLKASTLFIDYTICNTNDEVMPFHFGLHPAFNAPLDPSKSFDEYHLVCNEKEKGYEAQTIALDRVELKKTIILDQPNSSVYTLCDKEGKHGTSVHASGYPWVAFWSPNAPFVCIEPWYSHTDFKETGLSFEEREGAILLEAKKEWKTSYAITVY